MTKLNLYFTCRNNFAKFYQWKFKKAKGNPKFTINSIVSACQEDISLNKNNSQRIQKTDNLNVKDQEETSMQNSEIDWLLPHHHHQQKKFFYA